MKFGNVAAYCKGWYREREGIENMWKDLVHCIDKDGWMPRTKREVAHWCMNRWEDFGKEFPNEQYKVSFLRIYNDIAHLRDIVRINDNYRGEKSNYDEYDYIIWAYRDFIMNLDRKYFDSGVKPSSKVLPFKYKATYTKKRFEEFFPDYEEQTWQSYDHTYKELEKRIKESNPKMKEEKK